jgi:hypothetical protein
VGGALSPLSLVNAWAADAAAKEAHEDALKEIELRSDLVACPTCGRTNSPARLRLWWRALVLFRAVRSVRVLR